MESAAIARRFVEGLNTFDLTAVRTMLTADFEFTIGTHTADRDDFLASLATGPETDPRETGELATSAPRVLRLELDGELIRRAVVDEAS